MNAPKIPIFLSSISKENTELKQIKAQSVD